MGLCVVLHFVPQGTPPSRRVAGFKDLWYPAFFFVVCDCVQCMSCALVMLKKRQKKRQKRQKKRQKSTQLFFLLFVIVSNACHVHL